MLAARHRAKVRASFALAAFVPPPPPPQLAHACSCHWRSGQSLAAHEPRSAPARSAATDGGGGRGGGRRARCRRGPRRRRCRLRRHPAVTPYRRRHRLRRPAAPRVQVRDDRHARLCRDRLRSRRRRSCLGRRRSLGRSLRRPQRHRHLRRRRRLADHERLELSQTTLHRVELGESRLHRVEVRRRHLGCRLRLGHWRSRHRRRVGGDLLLMPRAACDRVATHPDLSCRERTSPAAASERSRRNHLRRETAPVPSAAPSPAPWVRTGSGSSWRPLLEHGPGLPLRWRWPPSGRTRGPPFARKKGSSRRVQLLRGRRPSRGLGRLHRYFARVTPLHLRRTRAREGRSAPRGKISGGRGVKLQPARRDCGAMAPMLLTAVVDRRGRDQGAGRGGVGAREQLYGEGAGFYAAAGELEHGRQGVHHRGVRGCGRLPRIHGSRGPGARPKAIKFEEVRAAGTPATRWSRWAISSRTLA